ncbi:MAG: hypothetical protein V4691_02455 [Pseudomonadota bacterium]
MFKAYVFAKTDLFSNDEKDLFSEIINYYDSFVEDVVNHELDIPRNLNAGKNNELWPQDELRKAFEENFTKSGAYERQKKKISELDEKIQKLEKSNKIGLVPNDIYPIRSRYLQKLREEAIEEVKEIRTHYYFLQSENSDFLEKAREQLYKRYEDAAESKLHELRDKKPTLIIKGDSRHAALAELKIENGIVYYSILDTGHYAQESETGETYSISRFKFKGSESELKKFIIEHYIQLFLANKNKNDTAEEKLIIAALWNSSEFQKRKNLDFLAHYSVLGKKQVYNNCITNFFEFFLLDKLSKLSPKRAQEIVDGFINFTKLDKHQTYSDQMREHVKIANRAQQHLRNKDSNTSGTSATPDYDKMKPGNTSYGSRGVWQLFDEYGNEWWLARRTKSEYDAMIGLSKYGQTAKTRRTDTVEVVDHSENGLPENFSKSVCDEIDNTKHYRQDREASPYFVLMKPVKKGIFFVDYLNNPDRLGRRMRRDELNDFALDMLDMNENGIVHGDLGSGSTNIRIYLDENDEYRFVIFDPEITPTEKSHLRQPDTTPDYDRVNGIKEDLEEANAFFDEGAVAAQTQIFAPPPPPLPPQENKSDDKKDQEKLYIKSGDMIIVDGEKKYLVDRIVETKENKKIIFCDFNNGRRITLRKGDIFTAYNQNGYAIEYNVNADENGFYLEAIEEAEEGLLEIVDSNFIKTSTSNRFPVSSNGRNEESKTPKTGDRLLEFEKQESATLIAKVYDTGRDSILIDSKERLTPEIRKSSLILNSDLFKTFLFANTNYFSEDEKKLFGDTLDYYDSFVDDFINNKLDIPRNLENADDTGGTSSQDEIRQAYEKHFLESDGYIKKSEGIAYLDEEIKEIELTGNTDQDARIKKRRLELRRGILSDGLTLTESNYYLDLSKDDDFQEEARKKLYKQYEDAVSNKLQELYNKESTLIITGDYGHAALAELKLDKGKIYYSAYDTGRGAQAAKSGDVYSIATYEFTGSEDDLKKFIAEHYIQLFLNKRSGNDTSKDKSIIKAIVNGSQHQKYKNLSLVEDLSTLGKWQQYSDCFVKYFQIFLLDKLSKLSPERAQEIVDGFVNYTKLDKDQSYSDQMREHVKIANRAQQHLKNRDSVSNRSSASEDNQNQSNGDTILPPPPPPGPPPSSSKDKNAEGKSYVQPGDMIEFRESSDGSSEDAGSVHQHIFFDRIENGKPVFTFLQSDSFKDHGKRLTLDPGANFKILNSLLFSFNHDENGYYFSPSNKQSADFIKIVATPIDKNSISGLLMSDKYPKTGNRAPRYSRKNLKPHIRENKYLHQRERRDQENLNKELSNMSGKYAQKSDWLNIPDKPDWDTDEHETLQKEFEKKYTSAENHTDLNLDHLKSFLALKGYLLSPDERNDLRAFIDEYQAYADFEQAHEIPDISFLESRILKYFHDKELEHIKLDIAPLNLTKNDSGNYNITSLRDGQITTSLNEHETLVAQRMLDNMGIENVATNAGKNRNNPAGLSKNFNKHKKSEENDQGFNLTIEKDASGLNEQKINKLRSELDIWNEILHEESYNSASPVSLPLSLVDKGDYYEVQVDNQGVMSAEIPETETSLAMDVLANAGVEPSKNDDWDDSLIRISKADLEKNDNENAVKNIKADFSEYKNSYSSKSPLAMVREIAGTVGEGKIKEITAKKIKDWTDSNDPKSKFQNLGSDREIIYDLINPEANAVLDFLNKNRSVLLRRGYPGYTVNKGKKDEEKLPGHASLAKLEYRDGKLFYIIYDGSTFSKYENGKKSTILVHEFKLSGDPAEDQSRLEKFVKEHLLQRFINRRFPAFEESQKLINDNLVFREDLSTSGDPQIVGDCTINYFLECMRAKLGKTFDQDRADEIVDNFHDFSAASGKAESGTTKDRNGIVTATRRLLHHTAPQKKIGNQTFLLGQKNDDGNHKLLMSDGSPLTLEKANKKWLFTDLPGYADALQSVKDQIGERPRKITARPNDMKMSGMHPIVSDISFLVSSQENDDPIADSSQGMDQDAKNDIEEFLREEDLEFEYLNEAKDEILIKFLSVDASVDFRSDLNQMNKHRRKKYDYTLNNLLDLEYERLNPKYTDESLTAAFGERGLIIEKDPASEHFIVAPDFAELFGIAQDPQNDPDGLNSAHDGNEAQHPSVTNGHEDVQLKPFNTIEFKDKGVAFSAEPYNASRQTLEIDFSNAGDATPVQIEITNFKPGDAVELFSDGTWREETSSISPENEKTPIGSFEVQQNNDDYDVVFKPAAGLTYTKTGFSEEDTHTPDSFVPPPPVYKEISDSNTLDTAASIDADTLPLPLPARDKKILDSNNCLALIAKNRLNELTQEKQDNKNQNLKIIPKSVFADDKDNIFYKDEAGNYYINKIPVSEIAPLLSITRDGQKFDHVSLPEKKRILAVENFDIYNVNSALVKLSYLKTLSDVENFPKWKYFRMLAQQHKLLALGFGLYATIRTFHAGKLRAKDDLIQFSFKYDQSIAILENYLQGNYAGQQKLPGVDFGNNYVYDPESKKLSYDQTLLNNFKYSHFTREAHSLALQAIQGGTQKEALNEIVKYYQYGISGSPFYRGNNALFMLHLNTLAPLIGYSKPIPHLEWDGLANAMTQEPFVNELSDYIVKLQKNPTFFGSLNIVPKQELSPPPPPPPPPIDGKTSGSSAPSASTPSETRSKNSSPHLIPIAGKGTVWETEVDGQAYVAKLASQQEIMFAQEASKLGNSLPKELGAEFFEVVPATQGSAASTIRNEILNDPAVKNRQSIIDGTSDILITKKMNLGVPLKNYVSFLQDNPGKKHQELPRFLNEEDFKKLEQIISYLDKARITHNDLWFNLHIKFDKNGKLLFQFIDFGSAYRLKEGQYNPDVGLIDHIKQMVLGKSDKNFIEEDTSFNLSPDAPPPPPPPPPPSDEKSSGANNAPAVITPSKTNPSEILSVYDSGEVDFSALNQYEILSYENVLNIRDSHSSFHAKLATPHELQGTLFGNLYQKQLPENAEYGVAETVYASLEKRLPEKMNPYISNAFKENVRPRRSRNETSIVITKTVPGIDIGNFCRDPLVFGRMIKLSDFDPILGYMKGMIDFGLTQHDIKFNTHYSINPETQMFSAKVFDFGAWQPTDFQATDSQKYYHVNNFQNAIKELAKDGTIINDKKTNKVFFVPDNFGAAIDEKDKNADEFLPPPPSPPQKDENNFNTNEPKTEASAVITSSKTNPPPSIEFSLPSNLFYTYGEENLLVDAEFIPSELRKEIINQAQRNPVAGFLKNKTNANIIALGQTHSYKGTILQKQFYNQARYYLGIQNMFSEYDDKRLEALKNVIQNDLGYKIENPKDFSSSFEDYSSKKKISDIRKNHSFYNLRFLLPTFKDMQHENIDLPEDLIFGPRISYTEKLNMRSSYMAQQIINNSIGWLGLAHLRDLYKIDYSNWGRRLEMQPSALALQNYFEKGRIMTIDNSGRSKRYGINTSRPFIIPANIFNGYYEKHEDFEDLFFSTGDVDYIVIR